MTRSLVIVNWHSSAHLREAVRTARASSSLPLEVIVVDNSCNEAEARALENAGVDRVVISGTNLGFGAGINRGVSESSGDLLLIGNPDVLFFDDAVDRLAGCVRDGHAVAGPRFVWDDGGRWLLPPAVSPRAAAQLFRSLSTHAGWLDRMRDREGSRSRIEFWSSDWPKSVRALSGAVLAMPRALFQRVGGFDPRFHLYFEEIDLLRRVRRGGGVLIHEPRAIVRHLFNQSASQRHDREQVYLESERRFHRKWFGTSMLLRLGRERAGREEQAPYVAGAPAAGAAWLEASPEPGFASAAGLRLERPVLPAIPGEIMESLGGGPLWVRGVSETGREQGRWIARATRS